MSAIAKSSGLTPSERYLKKLCERSFLSLWSYPNLFRNQGGGHELCDVLVVFGDDIVIFSDKSCAFPDTGDPQTDWERWFRRAVADSAKQVFGAERWIRQHPDRVFLDQRCTQPFPLDLSNPSRFRFHRVVVALGAGERCREANDGSGSMMLIPQRPDGTRVPYSHPFSVGWVVPGKPYVHVFDDVSITVLLNELDTVADFTRYLQEKEKFISSERLLYAPGEEDLMAHYLLAADHEGSTFPRHGDARVVFSEGAWADLQAKFAARRQRNKLSYLWDHLIETFARNVQAGTLDRGQEHSIRTLEGALRCMASESRLFRRLLGDAIGELFARTKPNGTNTRVVVSRHEPTRAYVISVISPMGFGDYATYERQRDESLNAYCTVAKHLYPSLKDAIGIGLEPVGASGGNGTERLVFHDFSTWTPPQAEMARELHEEAGLLRGARRGRATGYHFPLANQPPLSSPELRRQRNASKRARKERMGRRKPR